LSDEILSPGKILFFTKKQMFKSPSLFVNASTKETEKVLRTQLTQKELRLILTENCNYKCGFCHKE